MVSYDFLKSVDLENVLRISKIWEKSQELNKKPEEIKKYQEFRILSCY